MQFKSKRIHFIGIAGAGMSALSQISRMEGNIVSGSDRSFDNGKDLVLKKKFESSGIRIYKQDGSGISDNLNLVVVSTAVEDSNVEICRAKKLGLRIIHRSEMLSTYVERFKTIAVAGTSGKSTVVGMIFAILSKNGFSPGVLTGGPLIELKEKGLIGNAFKGKSDLLVIEADESDGTITRYKPDTGIILNISKDHKDIKELKTIFKNFAKNVKKLYVNSDDKNLKEWTKNSIVSGFSVNQAVDLTFNGFGSDFKLNGVRFSLPCPGLFNVFNAIAAVRVCQDFGISLEKCSQALKEYRGVERRFQIVGICKGITVIDDYAHNPAKISAVLESLHSNALRVLAIYQPHGFAPTRHLKNGLINAFVRGLCSQDILFMPEIYYAGGSVTRDISSKDLTDKITKQKKNAFFIPERDNIIRKIIKIVKSNDIIIVMGARDPTLSEFARKIFRTIKRQKTDSRRIKK